MTTDRKHTRDVQVSKSIENIETKNDVTIQDDFIPPDGGWGWMIVVAAGFSNFCMLPVLQSFGLLFRDRFEQMGINHSETTTIININSAVTACIGLINGPLFRKYSYRQVSLTGALVCAASISMLSMTKTFMGALIFFSILYGAGLGITMSANALALNTYFKEKRRVATGLSWTCTGMGPIVMPQIITLLVPIFGIEGTVLIFGGLAFNAVACALLLQPISLHDKGAKITRQSNTTYDKVPQDILIENKNLQNGKTINSNPTYRSKSLESVENAKILYDALDRAKQKFGSQYLYYDDEEDGATGIDVMGPGTPMMSRANDGWFSKKNTSSTSLVSKSSKMGRTPSRRPSVSLSRPPSLIALSKGPSIRTLSRQTSENESKRRKISTLQATAAPLIILSESCEYVEEEVDVCKEVECDRKAEEIIFVEKVEIDKTIDEKVEKESVCKSILKAIVVFFDLDLLRDLVYVNLMLGITLANFAELNFSILTPFILGEYGFSKIQVATMMSTLAGVDVAARLTIPFVASFIGWDNRTFFLVGVSGMAAGRIVLAHIRQDFSVVMAVAVLIGAGKALRTIFMALVIPSHVPLSRLPAATGLQLLISGIIFLAIGPIVGWIRDVTNFTVMLHALNIFTYVTVISWTLETYFKERKSKKEVSEENESVERGRSY